MNDLDENVKKIKELEDEIIDLKKRWPAHSLKPEMFEQLETLEEQLDYYKKLIAEDK